jgi:glycosyltransferase involved in cell wall biosynthesis
MKTLSIITMMSSEHLTFEITDVNELSKYYDKIQVYTLKNSSRIGKKKIYEENIEIINFSLNIFLFIKIFFKKKIFEAFFQIIRSNDALIEKIKLIYLLPRCYYISEELKNKRPNNIHFFWGHYPSLILYLLDNDIKSKISMFLGAYDLRKKLAISKLASKKANVIFTHSKSNMSEISDFLGRKDIKCIYRGVNLNIFDNKAHLAGSIKDRIIFTTIGSLQPHKNHFEIINAFEKIHSKYPHSVLNIFGEGYLEKKIIDYFSQKGLSEFINLHGWLPHEEVIKHLMKSHFYLHLSKIEVLPNSIKEALYASNIVISSRTTGIEELIQDYKTGFLVNPLDHDNIVNIVDHCLKNEDMTNKIIDEGKKLILEKFDLKKNIKSFYDIIK